jgi:bifunctional UDP-N-acetylglucosamine pyrophosphorylase/glucosamine-1-phosphate N-acetyltransferase
VESKKNNTKAMSVLILAAGLGTRMKSTLPKVLHNICGKSLIRRAAELSLKLPLEKRIVIIPPNGDSIMSELPKDFEYVVQEKPLGTGHAVLSAKALLKNGAGDLLILCGDTPLLTLETLKKFIEKHREGHYHGTVLTGKLGNPAGYGRIVRKGSGELSKIVEESEATVFEMAIEEINSGTYCFDWEILEGALNEIQVHPGKNELFLTDVIGVLTAKKGHVGAHCAEDAREVLGINSRCQLAEAEKVLRTRILDYWMDNGVTILDPQSTFIDETVVIGQDTIIHPFTVIEGEVTIGKKCVIGPFAHIRAKTVLMDRVEIGNFVEVKSSQIGEHVKAKHLTYLGDAIVGQGVNIGAGTITANYDGKKKHPTHIEDGAFIGSGTILVAPVCVGKGAITGAGSVVTRGKDVPEGTTVVGVPARLLKKERPRTEKEKSSTKNK